MDTSSCLNSLESSNILSLGLVRPKEDMVYSNAPGKALVSSRILRPIPHMAVIFSSTLKKKILEGFRKLYDIPEGVILSLPEAHKRACAISDKEIHLYK